MSRVLVDDAGTASLEDLPLDATAVVDGAPTTAYAPFWTGRGTEVGLWEMTEGTVTDVEEDEVFVVLSGTGTLVLGDGTSLPLRPGVAVHLSRGERTTWTITSPLRKVYVQVGVGGPDQ
ncbi:MAG: cupin domain-containing protein [Nocardioidaceae bacterium]|nr:cupin domain-containing protein [Nocardioidaceae bacterium]